MKRDKHVTYACVYQCMCMHICMYMLRKCTCINVHVYVRMIDTYIMSIMCTYI